MVGYIGPSILAFIAPLAREHHQPHKESLVQQPPNYIRGYSTTQLKDIRGYSTTQLKGASRTNPEEEELPKKYYLAVSPLFKHMVQLSEVVMQTHMILIKMAAEANLRIDDSDTTDLADWAWQYLDRFRLIRRVLSFLSSGFPDTDLDVLQQHAESVDVTSPTFGSLDLAKIQGFETQEDRELCEQALTMFEKYWAKWSQEYRQHFLYMVRHELVDISSQLKKEKSHEKRLELMIEVLSEIEKAEKESKHSSPTETYMKMLSNKDATQQDEIAKQAAKAVGKEKEEEIDFKNVQSMDDMYKIGDETLMKLSNDELKDLLNAIALRMEYPETWTDAMDERYGFSPLLEFLNLEKPKDGSPEKKAYDQLFKKLCEIFDVKTLDEMHGYAILHSAKKYSLSDLTLPLE